MPIVPNDDQGSISSNRCIGYRGLQGGFLQRRGCYLVTELFLFVRKHLLCRHIRGLEIETATKWTCRAMAESCHIRIDRVWVEWTSFCQVKRHEITPEEFFKAHSESQLQMPWAGIAVESLTRLCPGVCWEKKASHHWGSYQGFFLVLILIEFSTAYHCLRMLAPIGQHLADGRCPPWKKGTVLTAFVTSV